MATYHNEKPLSEIVLVNCFNKITANGIRTAEQLRQTEYYQEAIEAIYKFCARCCAQNEEVQRHAQGIGAGG